MNRRQPNETCITNVDDVKLADLIRSASQRLLLMAPGVSNEVAEAIGEAWVRFGENAVNAIVDVDPEVCRLGYGTLDVLKTLRENAARMASRSATSPP